MGIPLEAVLLAITTSTPINNIDKINKKQQSHSLFVCTAMISEIEIEIEIEERILTYRTSKTISNQKFSCSFCPL
jgi:hypothetical protein